MRYTTPSAAATWVEKSADVIDADPDYFMDIDGLGGIQLYDVEFNFYGNVPETGIAALYWPSGSPVSQELFSGGMSVSYNAANNVTRVWGRVAIQALSDEAYIQVAASIDDSTYSFNVRS